MRPLVDFHHFRAGEIPADDKVAQCEAWVVNALIGSELSDDRRDSSVAFELKHHHSVGQFARVLARKRDLPVDACTVGALLHDVYVVVEGRYADHAHRGAPIAQDVLDEVGGFDDNQRDIVQRIVYHHSDKHVWTPDPFVEFGKDADVLDCFLYPGAFGYYLRHKPLDVFVHYLRRAQAVWAEVGMPEDPRFQLLDGYGPNWMAARSEHDLPSGRAAVATVLAAGTDGAALAPPFYLRDRQGRIELAVGSGHPQAVDRHPGPAPKFLEEADELIAESARRGAGVLVWPAIEAFEIVGDDSPRLADLGIGTAASS